MYRLTARLEIESERRWVIDKITACQIERSTDDLTDTCKLTLPKRMLWDAKEGAPLRRGDKVRLSLGYDDNLQLAFVGYIREVGFKTPVVIECEDEMYQLKKKPTVKKAYRSVTLSRLLSDQGLTAFKVLGEQTLGAYRVKADNVAALLGELKEQGVRSFFRYEDSKPILYCGVLFDRGASSKPSQVIASGINLISDSSLKEQHGDTLRLKVKAISFLPTAKKGKTKKIKLELGDADGELRTLHTYGKTESELRAWAEQEIRRLKRDGLTGSLTTFGARLFDKLDTVGIIIDSKKKGIYQVKKVTIKYGIEGLRQEVSLGLRLAD